MARNRMKLQSKGGGLSQSNISCDEVDVGSEFQQAMTFAMEKKEG